MSKLQITRTDEPDGPVLALAGALDAYTAPSLRSELEALPSEPLATVVLDIEELGFIDSTGLRVLVEAHTARSDTGGALRLRNASETTRRLLDITGLADVLGVEQR